MNNLGKCKGCGCTVRWIKTAAGKNMPCDPSPLPLVLVPDGESFITTGGEMVRAIVGDKKDFDVIAYRPHWGTCRLLPASAARARRAEKAKREKQADRVEQLAFGGMI